MCPKRIRMLASVYDVRSNSVFERSQQDVCFSSDRWGNRPASSWIAEDFGARIGRYCLFISIATRKKVEMMRAPALMLPRRLPVTFDCPPLRRR